MKAKDPFTSRELTLISYQEILSFVFVGTALISLYLLDKARCDIKKGVKRNRTNLIITNRIIIFCLTIFFLFINLENTKIAKMRKQKLRDFYFQNFAAFLTVIAAFIILIVAFDDKNEFSDLENPLY